MSDAQDLAQRQLDAYNAGDIDAFVACYAQDVRIWDLHTNAITLQGRPAMRERYGALFERCPDLHAELVGRLSLGATAVDQERVTGMGADVVHAIATYEVRDGLIQQVWFART
ncbi:MAG: nuclear transport factor 2 family protein [Myxococcota bacterium]